MIWHFAWKPLRPVCGTTATRFATTGNPDQVTCDDCNEQLVNDIATQAGVTRTSKDN